MNDIRTQIEGRKIWVSTNETTDSEGRYVANVIIGTLKTVSSEKIYFLMSAILEKSNFSTVVKLFDKYMFVLWPNGIQHNDFISFVTDAVPYMVKAERALKSLYSKIIHFRCLAHGIKKC